MLRLQILLRASESRGEGVGVEDGDADGGRPQVTVVAPEKEPLQPAGAVVRPGRDRDGSLPARARPAGVPGGGCFPCRARAQQPFETSDDEQSARSSSMRPHAGKWQRMRESIGWKSAASVHVSQVGAGSASPTWTAVDISCALPGTATPPGATVPRPVRPVIRCVLCFNIASTHLGSSIRDTPSGRRHLVPGGWCRRHLRGRRFPINCSHDSGHHAKPASQSACL